jgi:hypothetical protein
MSITPPLVVEWQRKWGIKHSEKTIERKEMWECTKVKRCGKKSLPWLTATEKNTLRA